MSVDDQVILGRISGLFGVKGWVKVFSETQPQDNIFRYNPWHLNLDDVWRAVKLHCGRVQGKTLIAKLEGYDTRNAAAGVLGAVIAIGRQQLEPLPEGEYYWAQLIGLEVINLQGDRLGMVDALFETGANDVLVVKGERERLIPFVRDRVVRRIDLEQGYIRLDWDRDY